MTTATLVLSRVQKNLQDKIESIDTSAIDWRKVCFIGFFMALGLLIFYVWQINSLTGGYYLLNSYEKQVSSLSQENKNLQVSFAESSFLGQALDKIHSLNFQKTTSVRYVQLSGNFTEVAKK